MYDFCGLGRVFLVFLLAAGGFDPTDLVVAIFFDVPNNVRRVGLCMDFLIGSTPSI